MQQKETTNKSRVADVFDVCPNGRIIAIDPGTKRCGVAVCDELRVTTRPLPFIARKSWKSLLLTVKELIAEFDAVALVVGLPLESDGTDGPMTREARHIAQKFALSLDIPVVLQDERVTSYEARRRLWSEGLSPSDAGKLTDSTAAAIILADFLDRLA